MTTLVKNINKKFGSFQALYDINLQINDGEFVAILGPSGCGKTTLLRLLGGFETPTDGSIELNELEVANARQTLPPEKRNVSMVFQSFALWPHMTVSEHVKFPLVHDRFASSALKQNIPQRIKDVLIIVNLDAMADRMPHELSGGQKQRVSLARAIATEPQLLLMDEPLSSLDAELRMEMRREIQALHRQTQASIVYVTHDQGEALEMADRIVVMNAGRIEQIGTPEAIYYRPETPFVASFVGKANLFTGDWQGEYFVEKSSGVKWLNHGTTDELNQAGYYVIRPEQLKFSADLDGALVGRILTKQFQGKEYHYSVAVAGQVIIVHRPFAENFEIDQTVALLPSN